LDPMQCSPTSSVGVHAPQLMPSPRPPSLELSPSTLCAMADDLWPPELPLPAAATAPRADDDGETEFIAVPLELIADPGDIETGEPAAAMGTPAADGFVVDMVRAQHQRWMLAVAETVHGADPVTQYLLEPLLRTSDPKDALRFVASLGEPQVKAIYPPARQLVEGLRQRLQERLERRALARSARGFVDMNAAA